jgi:hypothetical protein
LEGFLFRRFSDWEVFPLGGFASSLMRESA